MKRALLIAFMALLPFMAFAKEAAPLAEDPAVEQRMVNITQELRCLVCQNESLAASQADLAQDLRREVRELVKAGKTDDEVRKYLVDRYGDFVLYRPQFKPMTWVLWAGPFALLVIGLVALMAFLRSRQRAAAALDAPLSDEERKRAEALLKENS
jgi:cytochrome c-type biogenesis protein CcmH